jgi:hypothetical protein
VCSTQESPLDALAHAIDDLAADSRDGAEPAHLADRIARLWSMLADLDPELARRRPRYEHTTDRQAAAPPDAKPPPVTGKPATGGS